MSNFSTSIMDDIQRGSTTTLAIGMGVLSLVPAVLPVMAQGVRPLLRGAIRGGLVCLEKGQEAVSEIRGVLEEVANQAKNEAAGHSHFHSSSYGQGHTASSGHMSSANTAPGPTQAYAASTPSAGTITSVPVARRPPPPDQKLETGTGEPDPEFLG